MGRRGRRWALAGLAVLAIGAVIAVVISRSGSEDRGVASDEAFAVVAPGPSQIRRATELQLRFETGTCYPGSDADLARQVNAPLRVEIQDRPEAVVIKARIDHAYVRSISPRSAGTPAWASPSGSPGASASPVRSAGVPCSTAASSRRASPRR